MVKKICFIGGGLRGGGQERALTSLANYFAGNGYQISIINLFKTEQFYPLESNIEIMWPKAERRKHHRLVYAFRISFYLRRTIKTVKPDILLSYGEWFNPFVILSTRLLSIPLYVLDRMGPEMKLDFLIETSKKAFYRFATGIITQTNTAAKIVGEKTGAKNIAVISNPVNNVNVDTSIKKKQIVTVGRLSKEKGHVVLIRAFSKLIKMDWTLHIVGDGPERSNLEEESSSLGISERVRFYGFKKDFANILGESEIFVLPSFYEGFPNALIEAMSVPLACISSDCVAGPKDIIEEGVNGLLVQPGNVDALTSSLNQLIENPELRKKLAYEAYKVRENLAFDKIAQQYLDFIFQ
jgi:GalNAc-alpha-(1->4)-GalNAc-alpha-(1->3)-diNAcBac-PP-undecaprenol alpha-1,4-N-acetyl-D-galactosaminyltransferase